jgi:hypothetical protein
MYGPIDENLLVAKVLNPPSVAASLKETTLDDHMFSTLLTAARKKLEEQDVQKENMETLVKLIGLMVILITQRSIAKGNQEPKK